MNDLNCKIIQTDIVWENPEANVRHYNEILSKIESPCDLIVLPEMCMTGFSTDSTENAEDENGKTYEFLKIRAKKLNSAIAAGITIKINENVYNRFLWVYPDGETEYYDKYHLFRMGGETRLFTPGKIKKVISYKKWNFLPVICYDLRFPELCRNNFDQGKFLYDCIICIANWPSTRKEVFCTIAKARAIENSSYLIAVNRTGKDGNALTYSGNSMLIDYKGDVIADMPENKEGIIDCNLYLDDVEKFRKKFPVHLDWNK